MPEVRSLVDRIDVAALQPGPPQPDRYVYEVDLCGERASVPEQQLTDELRRLVTLLL